MSVKPRAAGTPPRPALGAVLKQLPERRAQLSKQDDRINDAIVAVEQVLRENVDVRVEYVTYVDEDGDYQALVFGKHGGKWMLLWETGSMVGGETAPSNKVPLSDCSRKLRADVFAEGHVENLIRAALGRFEFELANRAQALVQVELLMEALAPFQVIKSEPDASVDPDSDIPF